MTIDEAGVAEETIGILDGTAIEIGVIGMTEVETDDENETLVGDRTCRGEGVCARDPGSVSSFPHQPFLPPFRVFSTICQSLNVPETNPSVNAARTAVLISLLFWYEVLPRTFGFSMTDSTLIDTEFMEAQT